MPRPLREDYEDAWHHVMNRGAAHQAVFLQPRDYETFLRCLAATAEETSVDVHGYCLLTNHFHLLVRSRIGTLSKFLKLLSGRYTRSLNDRVGRDGALFRGRTKTVLVLDEPQLLQTSRYIHLNPVEAKLASNPEDWPWSSARAYLGIDAPPSWLQTRTILDMFRQGRAYLDYREFLTKP